MRSNIAALMAQREALSSQFDETAKQAGELLKDTKNSLGALEDGIQENQRVIDEWNNAIGRNRD